MKKDFLKSKDAPDAKGDNNAGSNDETAGSVTKVKAKGEDQGNSAAVAKKTAAPRKRKEKAPTNGEEAVDTKSILDVNGDEQPKVKKPRAKKGQAGKDLKVEVTEKPEDT
jgi:hypothetical protein